MSFHYFNIIVHVAAGTIGLFVGLAALILHRQPVRHKRVGKIFLALLTVVVLTGFIGWIFFRSNPFLLMLTILSGYVGYAGSRTIRLRQQRAKWFDALIALVALGLGLLYLFMLLRSDSDWAPAVIYSTVGALVLVTVYDLLKYFVFYERIKSWWLYEHIYKMISAFSALFSAFVGTVLPDFKPYSQVGPSILCIWLIVFFIWREARRRARITVEYR
jgi:hypothetical protein